MSDLLRRPPLRADRRVTYGRSSAQIGDLWLPRGRGSGQPAPRLVFLHGGWWSSAFDLGHTSFLCAALRDAGVAVFSLEYRRVGASGGGWPATFLDAAQGLERAASLPAEFGLDGRRVVLMGHSAGAHLALWLAGRHHVFAGSAIETPASAVAISGVVALAGVVDLGLLLTMSQGPFAAARREVTAFMGGSPDEVPERYLAGDPGHLLPLNVPQHLLQGTADDQVPPELAERWAQKARRQGDHITVTMLAGAGHLDLIDPESRSWPAVLAAVRAALPA